MNPLGENTPFDFRGLYDTAIPCHPIGPRQFQFYEDWTWGGVTIEKGYVVDGASVPRIFWPILSPFTEGFRASIIHDFRHKLGMTWQERKFADDEYFRNLLKCFEQITRKKPPTNFARFRWFVRASLAHFGVRFWAWVTMWQFRNNPVAQIFNHFRKD